MNWAYAGQWCVYAILFSVAAYLYWRSVLWCGQRLYEADQEAQRRTRMGTLLEIADYLESKNAVRHHTQEDVREWEGPFMLDEPQPPRAA